MRLDWGVPALGRPLTEKEIKELQDKLQRAVVGKNVAHIYLIPSEIEWVRDNVENAHLIEISDDTSDATTWCIMGADEITAKHEYNRI